ncbi:LysR family transcriptional regulator [Citricoccus alkalitolerans]|uniref:LysR family transcriptional regulator n=1 Tax=Citricoccus alkalitolerans TaxID=246603 RepID=A0ABV8XYM0_9MICC
MNDVTLRQLEYLAAIAETGSATLAAEQCHVTQAAVSLALTQLERSLGATLVVRRRGRGVSLTPEGQAVAARARLIVDQVEEIGTVVRGLHGELSGRLTVGVFSTLARDTIPALLDWFVTHHPGVELDFIEGSGPEIQEAMLAGRAQLCVVYEAQLLPDCQGEALTDSRRLVALGLDHPLAAHTEIRLADLAPYPGIFVAEEPAFQRTLAEFAAAGVEPHVPWRSASVPAIHNVVGRNLAYSLLMQPVSHSPEGLPLIYRALADANPRNAVMVARPHGVTTSALVHEALVALREHWSSSVAQPQR